MAQNPFESPRQVGATASARRVRPSITLGGLACILSAYIVLFVVFGPTDIVEAVLFALLLALTVGLSALVGYYLGQGTTGEEHPDQ
jgi:hypothetical protein